MEYLKIKTDVLIIGGGGAGLRAAVAAADCGAQVILVSKRKVGIAGATAFPVAEMAGYNAGDIHIPGDTQSHYEDIMKAAQGMADPKLAAITAANAPGTISKLEEWGVEFEHVEEDYYIFKSCFSDSPRTHVIKGHGEPIIKALMKQIELRKENIKIMDDVTILRLVKENDRVCGAIGCREENLLKILVMDQIQILIRSMCDRKKLLQKLKSDSSEKNAFYEAGAKVRMLERKIAQAEEKNTVLYEDYVGGIVEKEDFDMMKERYIRELQNLRDDLQIAKQNQRILEKKTDRYMNMVSNLEQYLSDRSFNEALVQELVEYVEIYKNGSIHVCFKCDDKYKQITELIEGVKSA